MNKLLFGDNLQWLRDRTVFPDASIDLVYLDPPFNSNADYNVLFKEETGKASQAQFHAFTDTWNWADAAETYNEFVDTCPNIQVVELMRALHSFLKNSPMMAYLAMMAPRLVELRRVLKSTGNLYLHCDPTASHYLKIMLDSIFDKINFRNEIIWNRSLPHGNQRRKFGASHDVILFYAASERSTWHPQFTAHRLEYIEQFYRFKEPDGRCYRLISCINPNPNRPNLTYKWNGVTKVWKYTKERMQQMHDDGLLIYSKSGIPSYKGYLDQMKGTPMQDNWIDIPPLMGSAAERLGYPTQKPQALLERIINASSNTGDVILDPFCGCGTTIHAAQKLHRKWIGIDITYLAINLIKRRLHDAFGKRVKYEERGQPTDFESAKRLAELDKFQFQQWALSLVDARPLKEGSGKGADRGVDGLLYFYESKTERAKILVQVKGGGVKRSDIATLVGDVNNQDAVAGVLITLEKPTRPMREEAAEAGRYTAKLYPSKNFPKIQILTIEGLISETERLDVPPQSNVFAKAVREAEDVDQEEFL